MNNLALRVAELKPIDRYAYLDVIWGVLRTPLTQIQEQAIRSAYRAEYGTGEQRRCSLEGPFRSYHGARYRLHQPPAEVLRLLGQRNDLRLTYAEVALDLIFPDQQQREEAYALLDWAAVKKHHRRTHHITHCKRTRYSCHHRRTAHQQVMYDSRECRLTGELHCQHIEQRIRHERALLRHGLGTIPDLLTLDYRQFWQRYLLLYAIDIRKLGQLSCNHAHHTHRRSWVTSYGKLRFDHHQACGQVLQAGFHNVQEIIDLCRPHIATAPWLVRLSADHLLPAISLD